MDTTVLIDLVVVFSCALVVGTIVRYAIPGRVKHGLLLVPSFAIVFALLVWEISIWAGLGGDFGQLALLILMVLTAGATVAFSVLLVRRRTHADDEKLASALAGIRTL